MRRRTSPHIPELDGLRGLAIVLVVLAHAGITPGASLSGAGGVTVFFVLSGFLITRLLIQRYEQGDRFVSFYMDRVVRLVPALLTMEVVCAIVWAGTGRSLSRLVPYALTASTYTENFFQSAHQNTVFAPTWSLAVEEQFYLLWPFLLLLITPLSRRSRLILCAGGIVASILCRLAFDRLLRTQSYASLPTNAFALLAGCAIALYGAPDLRRRAVTLAVGIMVALLVLPPLMGHSSWLLQLGWAAASAVVVIASANRTGSVFSWPPLRYVGRVSYAWYLWHWPLMWFTGTLYKPVDGGIVAVGAFAVAMASTHLLEEPLRRRWRLKQVAR